jgi:LemA protein
MSGTVIAVIVILVVLLVVVGIAVAVVISMYNRLVTLRQRFQNAFSQIDVQLKRRHDLIPNLVETAKGYMKHERETLENVIQARNQAQQAQEQASQNPGDPKSMQQLGQSEGQLTGALGRLFAVAESYPDLKANQNVMQVQEELTSTENKISFSRQAYNDAVMKYNTYREKFPGSIIAGMFNFGEAEYFEIEEPEQREAPEVSF